MHGICFDYPLQDWFDFEIPETTIPEDFIYDALTGNDDLHVKPSAKVVWLGGKPATKYYTKTKKGNSYDMIGLHFHGKKERFDIQVPVPEGTWLVQLLEKASIYNPKIYTFSEIISDFETSGLENFELFWQSKPIATLRDFGLLKL